MKYEEFRDKAQAGIINVGDDVWMAHVQYQPGHITLKKNIAPVKVRLVEVAQRWGTYGIAECMFREVKRDGTTRAKNISPYADQWAIERRELPGASAEFFFTEEEARRGYKQQCKDAQAEVQKEIDRKIQELTKLSSDIDIMIMRH
jgi:hypothetical protein